VVQPVDYKSRPPTLTQGEATILSWAGNLVDYLARRLAEFGRRINGSIHEDGTVPMKAPLKLAFYLDADVPDAADFEGCIIYVSDGGAGQRFRGSDGATWVDLG
jgi:hypothetical protein